MTLSGIAVPSSLFCWHRGPWWHVTGESAQEDVKAVSSVGHDTQPRAVCRFDLVAASYVIGEARSPSERRRLVDSLWRRTGGVLVLVEPGTPVGSANIREARAQVCASTCPTSADTAGHDATGFETPSLPAVGRLQKTPSM